MADVELVIRIPEEEYRWIMKSNVTVFADVASKECMLHAIKNGTPLPKGHGKLFDAREYEKSIRKHYFDNDTVIRCTEIALGDAETIIEADTEGREDSTRTLQDGQERE